MCSSSILFEPKGRRIELALFFAPKFLETVYRYVDYKGYGPNVDNLEVVAFCAAMAFLMYCFENQDKNIKGSTRGMIGKGFGEN